jgi:hypothetical protein
VEPANDGAPVVSLRLVRHALRRRELFARKRATVVRWWRGLRVLVTDTMVGMVTLAIAISVLGNRITRTYSESRVDMTRIKIKKYAYEAYPSWRAAEPGRVCPGSLHELDAYMDSDDDRDAWRHPLEFRCGPGAPGLWVRSAGEDGTFDTADDLDSLH